MVKWTSKKGEELQEVTKVAILTGDFGNIFEPGFEPKEFPHGDLFDSNPEFDANFKRKNFKQNTENMIE